MVPDSKPSPAKLKSPLPPSDPLLSRSLSCPPADDMDALFQVQTSVPSSMAKRPCPSQNPKIPTFTQMRLLDSLPSDLDQTLLIDRALKMGTYLLEAGKRSARIRATKHNSVVSALPPDLTIKESLLQASTSSAHPPVFSMLDAQSLFFATATCSMFHKCAMDPSCYSNIDLTTVSPRVNNAAVSTMIHRAGKLPSVRYFLLKVHYLIFDWLGLSVPLINFRSLKLGIVPGPTSSPGSCQPLVYNVSSFSWNDKRSRQGKKSSVLTRSCLSPLGGASTLGMLLKMLHLYNIERLDSPSLRAALSACPSLLYLEIVGLNHVFRIVNNPRPPLNIHVELRQTLMSVIEDCPLIERLFFESSKTGRDDSLKSSTCVDLVQKCPRLVSLALGGFKLHDYKVRILVKVFSAITRNFLMHAYINYFHC
uniref:F-box protein n=1 Tax=Cucumis melo TaxID=3656 RepID=A0A9I9DBC0_CUCME